LHKPSSRKQAKNVGISFRGALVQFNSKFSQLAMKNMTEELEFDSWQRKNTFLSTVSRLVLGPLSLLSDGYSRLFPRGKAAGT
jgi:hypothetical protein